MKKRSLKNKKCCWNNIDKAKRIGRCNYVCSECGGDVSLMWFLYLECMKETEASKKLGDKL